MPDYLASGYVQHDRHKDIFVMAVKQYMLEPARGILPYIRHVSLTGVAEEVCAWDSVNVAPEIKGRRRPRRELPHRWAKRLFELGI